jgi:hypothetical protein
MSKIEKLALFLGNPFKVINGGLELYREESFRKKNIKDFRIEQLPTIDICDLFPDFSESINKYTFLEGTSLVTDILLLKLLARGFRACAYLEIGSWRGESIANVYEVTDDCTSVTLSEEEMREMKLGEDFIKVHGIYTKGLKNIKKIEHNSHTFDLSALNKKFDLIFIDGDHSYNGVLADTRKTFSLRKESSSVIVWHDYGSSTERVRHSVLAAILSGVPEEYHKNLFHVSNTLCAVYMENNNLETGITRFPSFPNKNFIIKLSAEKL